MAGLDLQAIFDARAKRLLMSDTEKALEKQLLGEFDDAILQRVAIHQEAIKTLKADATAGNNHAAAIAFHEKRIAYYMS